MTPYMRSLIDPADVRLFEEVCAFIERIPDVELSSGRDVSCHMVARIVSERFDLPVVDGRFGRAVAHSWLEFGGYILDVYPVGAMRPQMLHIKYMTTPWGDLFDEEDLAVVKTPEFETDYHEFLKKARA